jgi:hypothetical protein
MGIAPGLTPVFATFLSYIVLIFYIALVLIYVVT